MIARKRLGEMLMDQGAIDDVQLSAALGHQRRWGGKLGQALVDLHIVPEPIVTEALARSLECEPASTAALSHPAADALKLVPAALARKHQILPLELVSDGLVVATADPGNVAALDELRFRTGRRLKVRLAGARAVSRAIDRAYGEQLEFAAIDLDDVLLDDDLPPGGIPVERTAAGFQERFYPAALRDPKPPALRAVQGGAPTFASASPESVVQALTAVLMRRGLVTEAELVAELTRNSS